jgi:hypothetical protein
MGERFFVRVYASSPAELARLNEFGLDLFQPTSVPRHVGDVSIEGLLTEEEIERVRAAGYQVEQEESAEARARADQAVDFDEWRKGMTS